MKIAALFPGQGAQYVGMGKQLYETYSVVKDVFHEASDCLGMNVQDLCFNGSQELLKKTEITQPVVLTVGVAAAKVLQSEYGIDFTYGAGHSLGEYTALTAANAIKFQDAVKLVHLRGKYMQEAVAEGTGAMSVVNGLSVEEIEEVCEDLQYQQLNVEISNYNSPYQTVISGLEQAVSEAEKLLVKKQGKVIRLKVSAPFHSSLMEPAADKMKVAFDCIKIEKPKFMIVSNVTGVPYMNENHIKDSLVAQMTRAVEWRKSMEFLYLNDVDLGIDMGPQRVVKGLLTRNYAGMKALSMEDDFEEIKIVNQHERR